MCALSLAKQLSPTAGTQEFSEECARIHESYHICMCLCVRKSVYFGFSGVGRDIIVMYERVFVRVDSCAVAFISWMYVYVCVCMSVFVCCEAPPESVAIISI